MSALETIIARLTAAPAEAAAKASTLGPIERRAYAAGYLLATMERATADLMAELCGPAPEPAQPMATDFEVRVYPDGRSTFIELATHDVEGTERCERVTIESSRGISQLRVEDQIHCDSSEILLTPETAERIAAGLLWWANRARAGK
jgi:hypothetical protein